MFKEENYIFRAYSPKPEAQGEHFTELRRFTEKNEKDIQKLIKKKNIELDLH